MDNSLNLIGIIISTAIALGSSTILSNAMAETQEKEQDS